MSISLIQKKFHALTIISYKSSEMIEICGGFLMGQCGCGSKDSCCFSCCAKKEFVQDKLCCEWSLTTENVPTIVYQTNINSCNIVASGFIKFCGPAGSQVRVEFLRGGEVVSTTDVNEGSCFTFTVSRFDTIRVTAVSTVTSPITGEICITPRYTLPH
jgi:Protein of unknown function (DUF3992)